VKQYLCKVRSVGNGLLMHRYPELSIAGLVCPPKAAGRTKPKPEDEAEAGAYRTEDGALCLLADHFHGSMTQAAVNFQVEGRGKKTYKELIGKTAVVEPDIIPLTWDGKPLREYLIDARPAIVNRSRIVRCRPHVPRWEAEFTVTLQKDELVSTEALRAILAYAGDFCRVGDYRQRFGRFEVAELREVALAKAA